MSVKGITHVLPILFMINMLWTTAVVAGRCRRCYGIMCAITCKSPERVGNMKPHVTCRFYHLGSSTKYTCYYNHHLTEISHCMSNGQWSNLTMNCPKPVPVVSSTRSTTTQLPETTQTAQEKTTPILTTEGTTSTLEISTADRESTLLRSTSDDLNLSKSQKLTTSTTTDPTTEKINSGHQLQTTELEYGTEFDETGIGNHTREMMEALGSEKAASSTVIIALSTIVVVIIVIILIIVLFLIKFYKNKGQHNKSRIPTSVPTDITTTV